MSSTLDLRQGRVLKPKAERAPSKWRHIRASRTIRIPIETKVNPATKLETVVRAEERPLTKREAKQAAYAARRVATKARKRHGRR